VRILLDECVDEAFRFQLVGHECQTCRYAGLKGLSNGELLAAAEEAGFEVLITVDRNMPHQQSIAGRKISLMVVEARTTNIEDLIVLVPDLLTALDVLRPGDMIRVGWR
jgi:hypothetical protein